MKEKRRRRIRHRASRKWQSFRIGAGSHFIDTTQIVLSDTIETSAVHTLPMAVLRVAGGRTPAAH